MFYIVLIVKVLYEVFYLVLVVKVLCEEFFLVEYRNKESSQTTLEAETEEARSKDLKIQVTSIKK